jgi:hypothetical protein
MRSYSVTKTSSCEPDIALFPSLPFPSRDVINPQGYNQGDLPIPQGYRTLSGELTVSYGKYMKIYPFYNYMI